MANQILKSKITIHYTRSGVHYSLREDEKVSFFENWLGAPPKNLLFTQAVEHSGLNERKEFKAKSEEALYNKVENQISRWSAKYIKTLEKIKREEQKFELANERAVAKKEKEHERETAKMQKEIVKKEKEHARETAKVQKERIRRLKEDDKARVKAEKEELAMRKQVMKDQEIRFKKSEENQYFNRKLKRKNLRLEMIENMSLPKFSR